MNILVVDDDAVPREILRKILVNNPHHQVAVAADGNEAWTRLDDAGRFFDVVFLDLVMPAPDGFELLQRIRSSPILRSTEVVVCSAMNDRASVARAIQLGAHYYLIKPCTEALVTAKLNLIQPLIRANAERRLAHVG